MTDETKQLFDAPWRATDLDYVEDVNGFCVCECGTHLTASNIARLPELYEALLDEIRAKCNTCIHDNIRLGRVPFINHFNTIQSGCPFKDSQCHTVKHIEIIQKVRDGE